MKFKLNIHKYYNKIINKSFSIYSKEFKNSDNPSGFCFQISPKDKSVYVIGKYRYFTEKEFRNIMKKLKEVVSFYEDSQKKTGVKE